MRSDGIGNRWSAGRGVVLCALSLACSLAAARAQEAAPAPSPVASPRASSALTTRPITLEAPKGPAERATDAAMLSQWGILPPLSIYESSLLLKQALSELEENPGKPAVGRESAMKVEFILRVVGNYIQQVDAAHPTLPYYRWTPLASEKITAGGWKTLALKPRRPIANVTALALRVHNGDVELGELVVVDVDQTQWVFNRTIAVAAEQPRPDVCFLGLPTRVVEIRLKYRPRDPEASNRPRLFVDVGVCGVRESGKQAQYYLQIARDDLDKQLWPSAAGNLRRAFEMLQEFQKSRRL
jgi:hypothetical protein